MRIRGELLDLVELAVVPNDGLDVTKRGLDDLGLVRVADQDRNVEGARTTVRDEALKDCASNVTLLDVSTEV